MLRDQFLNVPRTVNQEGIMESKCDLETTCYIIYGDWYLMAAYAHHHPLPFGNYHTLHYLVYPSLEKMGSDKKNKRIESREICDSDSGSSLEAYIEGIFVSSMEQMVIFGIQERSLIEQIA
jgi:hypothetical protein